MTPACVRCSIRSPMWSASAKISEPAAGSIPIFVALTARATAIGRSIQSIAEARRNRHPRFARAAPPRRRERSSHRGCRYRSARCGDAIPSQMARRLGKRLPSMRLGARTS